MSESQKKRRDLYRKNRSRWIWMQSIVLAILALLVLIGFVTYGYVSKIYYVDYTEASDVD